MCNGRALQHIADRGETGDELVVGSFWPLGRYTWQDGIPVGLIIALAASALQTGADWSWAAMA